MEHSADSYSYLLAVCLQSVLHFRVLFLISREYWWAFSCPTTTNDTFHTSFLRLLNISNIDKYSPCSKATVSICKVFHFFCPHTTQGLVKKKRSILSTSMANYPIDKQFSRLGISNPPAPPAAAGWPNHQEINYGTSPNSQYGQPSMPTPKQLHKAQPQVPVIPKSFHVPLGGLEPSFSSLLLKNQNMDDEADGDARSSGRISNYENINMYQQQQQQQLHHNNGSHPQPIYGNIQHNSSSVVYLPPPPPPPAPCDSDLPLPPPPAPSDLSSYYHSTGGLDVSDDSLLFPDPPDNDDDEEEDEEEVTSTPPSPVSLVSSSYSELRRADCGSTTGSTSNYAPLSQVIH